MHIKINFIIFIEANEYYIVFIKYTFILLDIFNSFNKMRKKKKLYYFYAHAAKCHKKFIWYFNFIYSITNDD